MHYSNYAKNTHKKYNYNNYMNYRLTDNNSYSYSYSYRHLSTLQQKLTSSNKYKNRLTKIELCE